MTACGQIITHLPHWMHNIFIPNRDFQREVALFPLGRASGEGAVNWEGRDGDVIAVESMI
jgi:hypothetical protein